MKTAFRFLLALAAAFALCLPASAQESTDPAVAAAQSANTALTQCISAVTQGAATAEAGVKTMLLIQAPDMCRKSVVVAQIRQAPSTGEMIWDGAKVFMQLVAAYKGQSLMWNGITTLVGRQADSTDNAVNQGFNTANTSVGEMGSLAGQAFDKIPSPEAVGN